MLSHLNDEKRHEEGYHPMDAALEELRATYAKELPEKAKELRDSVAKVIASLRRLKEVDWSEFEYYAHKLAGSSGTYGFNSLAVVCRYIEDVIVDGRLKNAPPAHAIEHIDRWLAVFDEQVTYAHERRPAQKGSEATTIRALEIHLERKAA